MLRKKRAPAWKSAAARHLLNLAGNPASLEEAIRIMVERLLPETPDIPPDLEELAHRLGLSKATLEDESNTEEDPLHDDGLRFYETPTSSLVQQRQDLALTVAKQFFASLKPRGFTRGAELETLCYIMAHELLLPTKLFHQARTGPLSVSQVVEMANQFQVNVRISARKFASLPYVAIFSASQDYIHWAYGGIRTGRIDQMDPEFRALVQYALREDMTEPLSFFSPKKPWFGSRRMEWIPVGINQTLVLIRLPRRDERSSSQAEADMAPDHAALG